MISLFWKSSSDIMSGFSQFNQRGRFAEDIILHSSRLKQRGKHLQMLLTAANKPNLHRSIIPTERQTASTEKHANGFNSRSWKGSAEGTFQRADRGCTAGFPADVLDWEVRWSFVVHPCSRASSSAQPETSFEPSKKREDERPSVWCVASPTPLMLPMR